MDGLLAGGQQPMRVSPLTDVRVRETRPQAGPCAAFSSVLRPPPPCGTPNFSAVAWTGVRGVRGARRLMMQRLVTPNSRDFRIVRYSRRFVLRWYTAVACKLAIWWWSAPKQPPNRRRDPDPPFPTAAAPPAPRFAGTPRCRGLWGRTRDDANMFWCLLGLLFGMLTDAQSLGRNCARPDEQMKAFVAQWSERQTFNLNVASSSLAEGVFLNTHFLEFWCFCAFLHHLSMILTASQGFPPLSWQL